MSRVPDNAYFIVQKWMVSDLNLKSLERDLYAIIFGYSQDGESEFHGSLNYLAELTGYSKQSVITSLKALVSKQLIIREEKLLNGIKFCRYRVDLDTLKDLTSSKATLPLNELNSSQVALPPSQVALPPSQVALSNNKDINKNNINNTNVLLPEPVFKETSKTKNHSQVFNEPMYNSSSKDLFNELRNYEPAHKHDDRPDTVAHGEDAIRKMFGIDKPTKKPNLYQKCLDMIDNFTDSPNLRKALVNYLNLRLEMKDKPIKYSNQWKGMLNQLAGITEVEEDQLDIVQQSIVKGWAIFVEKKDYSNQKQDVHKVTNEGKSVKSSRALHITEDDVDISERRY